MGCPATAFPAAAATADFPDVELRAAQRLFARGDCFLALAIADSNIPILISYDCTDGKLRLVPFRRFLVGLAEHAALAAAEFSFCLADEKEIILKARQEHVDDFRLKDQQPLVEDGLD